MDTFWEKASKALDSIPSPKEHLYGFVDKMTQLDEKVSEFLVPQIQEVSGPAMRLFQKMRSDEDVGQEWVEEAEEKINLSKKAVEELSNCTKKVKDLLDTFQTKTNLQWTLPRPTTDWRSKYSTRDNPPPGENDSKEVWHEWLTKKLAQILEFTRDEIMPAVIGYSALPVSVLVIITTLCPPLAHAAPGVMGGLATAVCGLYSLNKVLPSLIEMLRNAKSGIGTTSRLDKIRSAVMTSFGPTAEDN